jgi:PleD family two-component response regulator
MLPDTGEPGAAKVAERICLAVEALNIEHKSSRVLGVVSVSIGVATLINLKAFNLDKNIQAASQALQRASSGKGNCFETVKLTSMVTSGI